MPAVIRPFSKSSLDGLQVSCWRRREWDADQSLRDPKCILAISFNQLGHIVRTWHENGMWSQKKACSTYEPIPSSTSDRSNLWKAFLALSASPSVILPK